MEQGTGRWARITWVCCVIGVAAVSPEAAVAQDTEHDTEQADTLTSPRGGAPAQPAAAGQPAAQPTGEAERPPVAQPDMAEPSESTGRTVGRVFLEIGAGAAGIGISYGLAVAGLAIGWAADDDCGFVAHSGSGDCEGTAAGFGAGAVAMPFIVAGGVSLGGNGIGGHGSYLATMGGAVLGSLPGAAALAAAPASDLSFSVGLGLYPVGALIGAMLGYELSYRPRGAMGVAREGPRVAPTLGVTADGGLTAGVVGRL